jgi:hypothetical protein
VSKIRPFIFFSCKINYGIIIDPRRPISIKAKSGIGMHCSRTEITMDRAAVASLFWSKVDWQGGPLRNLRFARSILAMNELNESLTSLDEIAAWVNEGGAGGEVRR